MHYPLLDLTDFCFILVFFVIPGLFSPVNQNVSVPNAQNIPWTSIFLYGALVIYMAVRYHLSKPRHSNTVTGFLRKTVTSFSGGFSNVFMTFVYLGLSNYIVTKAALRFGGENALPVIQISVSSTGDKVFLVLWTVLLASFEEFTYRWLIPFRLRSLVFRNGTEDEYTVTKKVLCELAVICLFALSHRYMGWWAVLNACIAGIILRTRFFISGSVYPALIAHTLYNLTAFYGILKP